MRGTASWLFSISSILLLAAGGGCEVEPRSGPQTCDDSISCPPGTECNPKTSACVPRSRPEPPRDVGRFCKIQLTPDNIVLVASYASDLGDLELLSGIDPKQPGVRTAVDGAPDDRGDPDVGQHADLVVAEDGTLHLAYYDADRGSLRYARRDSRGWDIRVLDEDGDAGRFASIGLDAQGWPRVAYTAGSTSEMRTLRLARASPSGWSRETVDTGGVGRFASLVLAGEAERVAYYDELQGALKLAARGAGGWGTVVVDDGVRHYDDNGDQVFDRTVDHDVGRWAAAAAGPDGRIAIAYFDATLGRPLYAHTEDGGTVIEPIWEPDDSDPAERWHIVGQFASLVFDNQGRARVVFQDSTTLDLRGAVRESDGSWTPVELAVDDEPAGFWANQSIGPGNETLVCHYRPARSASGEPEGRLEWLRWMLK